jgi:hypothetical protein
VFLSDFQTYAVSVAKSDLVYVLQLASMEISEAMLTLLSFQCGCEQPAAWEYISSEPSVVRQRHYTDKSNLKL